MSSFARRHVLATLAFLMVASRAAGATQVIDDSLPLPDRPRAAPWDPELTPGQEAEKPGEDGTFLVDANQGGAADSLHLVALEWRRLVDVHGLDANGAVDPRPYFRDFAISETIQSNATDYRLLSSYATHGARLVILRRPGTAEFAALLAQADQGPAILPKSESAPPPFSFVARNAVLVARFDDLLRDSQAAAAELSENVRVRLLVPHLAPYQARVTFDANHGGVARGKFHSTRVLIDLSISEFEASQHPLPLQANILGLPDSPSGTGASASLRIPTRTDPGSGQFTRLTNLRDRGLAITGNGPVDIFGATQDVVRAMRAGNEDDVNNGFLLDLDPPALLGSFAVDVSSASADPQGEPGFAFVVGWTFTGPCGLRPLTGNVLAAGAHRLEVIANAGAPTASGQVAEVRVRLIGAAPASVGELLGAGLFQAPLRSGSPLDPACWVRFVPAPSDAPAAGVSPSAFVIADFSEPMNPGSVRRFESLRLVRGNGSPVVDATSLVVADFAKSTDLDAIALTPLLPLAHQLGTATPYQFQILGGSDGITDLVGNALVLEPQPVDFTLDPLAATESNAGVALRFESTDELEPPDAPDLRGSFFYDLSRGRVRPRPVAFTSVAADRNNPVPSIMTPLPNGVFTPLAPLGSKLHQVWRYSDLGWSASDESKHDLDVVGLNWSPIGGLVITDFYENFEIRLAHSRFLPDEDLNQFLLPKYPNSGLRGGPNNLFTDNILEDPSSPQKVVHPRQLGYAINPAHVFLSPAGTPLIPYPLNRGAGPMQTYTWRDTAVLAVAGPNGAGVPTDIEVGAPLFLAPATGTLAPAGQVPSVGLPLLMEFRCYPSDTGIGLNRLDVSLAINSSPLPAFRAFSTGGFNTAGNPVTVNPDLNLVPQGGFDPTSTPPGLRTPSRDCLVYMGQVDFVTRVSRMHSIWIDAQSAADFAAPLVEADPAQGTPGPSAVVIEYRGATGFSPDALDAPFDARQLDAYGDLEVGSVLFHGGKATWSDDIDFMDGARYLQLRVTFTNDIETGASPELDSIGLAFQH